MDAIQKAHMLRAHIKIIESKLCKLDGALKQMKIWVRFQLFALVGALMSVLFLLSFVLFELNANTLYVAFSCSVLSSMFSFVARYQHVKHSKIFDRSIREIEYLKNNFPGQ